MPLTSFETLPPDARVWVFAANDPLTGAIAERLLTDVDVFLDQWKAHGAPLRAARDWRDDRFLTVAIDPTAEQASGCSIDGLFRMLQQLERVVGTRLVGGGRVFYRTASGVPAVTSRDEFESMASRGEVSAETPVFDLTLTTLDRWRSGFERPARESVLSPMFPVE